MKFSELELHPLVYSGVEASGFLDCTPIQEAAIPHILAGRDIAGLAQTGTGKTAAFVLPLMDRILSAGKTPTAFKDWLKTNFVLVLVPTRELAEQVCECVKKFGTGAGIKAAAIYGGTAYEGQKAAIRGGVQFIVATPGRLIDLYKEHMLDLGQVRAIVFDEADRMFDMGFKDDMKYILRRVPQDRQFLVFSATLNFDVLNTSYEFGATPVEVNVSRDQAKAENVIDEIYHVGHEDKPKYLLSLIQKTKPAQVIVFSNFKHNVDRIARFLSSNGMPAMGISSLISQSQRTRIMELFRNVQNDRNILVATDVAARGLDIKGVDLVMNYELPDDAENYVHRIGRTGRAGANGTAISLVGDRDVEALQRIETYLGHKVKIGWIEDTELVKEFKPFAAEERKREYKSGGGQYAGGGKKPFRPNRDRPYRDQNSQGGSRPNESGGYRSRPGPQQSSSAQSSGGSNPDGAPARHSQSSNAPRPSHTNRPRHWEKKSNAPAGAGGEQQRNPQSKPTSYTTTRGGTGAQSPKTGSSHSQSQKRTGSAHPPRERYTHKPTQAQPTAMAAVGKFIKKLFGKKK